jgi:hypothetical protein
MPSILAIVSKSIFEQDCDFAVGDLYETSEYLSKHKALDALADGGSLFLVTARPGDQLWLVAILEKPIYVGDRWAGSANKVRIADITTLADRLVFDIGTGIKAGAPLGMALQSPRKLTDGDVALLRGAVAPARPAPASPKRR